jgi:MFS family permease
LNTLLVGQTVSSLGDWMGTIALIVLVQEITDSAAAVGGVLVLRLTPAVLAGPLAARLTLRWSRRRIMLAMDAVRVPFALVLPWVTELWWIYTWALLLEVASLVFLPARDASIPDLQEPGGDLGVANGLVLGTSYGMIPVGAGVYALVAVLAGSHADQVGVARIVFLVDAITFVLSYLAIARLPEIGSASEAPGEEADGGGGFRDALRLTVVRRMAPIAAVVAAGLGALFSLGVVWVSDVLDASDVEFGLLVACFGVGAGLGLLILRRLGERDFRVVKVALVAQGGVVATMSLAPTIGFALLGALGFGAATALVLATSMELLQREVEERHRVLAFTAFHVAIRGGLALAAMGAGVAQDAVDAVNWPLVGRFEPAQVVLMASGLLVAAVGLLSRPPPETTPPIRT